MAHGDWSNAMNKGILKELQEKHGDRTRVWDMQAEFRKLQERVIALEEDILFLARQNGDLAAALGKIAKDHEKE